MADVIPFPNSFQEMDDAKPSKLHWKIMFISGMGFFTDAYDLFIIGVVMTMLKPLWHVGKVEEGLVESTALLAAALGALLFGRVADMVGRKRIYGVEVLVLAAGAIGSAFSPNIWWLIGLRFILGIGIGGDYPVSATIMSEYAGKASRGMMVTLVFAMQAAGLIVGLLLASALLATHLSHDITWHAARRTQPGKLRGFCMRPATRKTIKASSSKPNTMMRANTPSLSGMDSIAW